MVPFVRWFHFSLEVSCEVVFRMIIFAICVVNCLSTRYENSPVILNTELTTSLINQSTQSNQVQSLTLYTHSPTPQQLLDE